MAVAEAAWRHDDLVRVDLVLSEAPLGKEHLGRSSLEARLEALRALALGRPWLGVRRTDAKLVAEVAAGYDIVVVGADKWAQLLDPAWYGGSLEARDAAVASLPWIRVAPRPPLGLPEPDPPRLEILALGAEHAEISSTAVRAGRGEWAAYTATPPRGDSAMG